MILFLKGSGVLQRHIRLIKVVLNMITTTINTRLRESISLHDILHRFLQGVGVGTATWEAKLA